MRRGLVRMEGLPGNRADPRTGSARLPCSPCVLLHLPWSTIPFLLFSTAQVALRVSNLIAIVMLFCLDFTGWDSTAAIRHGGRLQHGIARPGAGGDCDRPRGMTTNCQSCLSRAASASGPLAGA